MSSGPRNFSWFVKGKLAGMGYPTSEDVPFLAQLDIRTLVDLTGSYPSSSCRYTESARACGLTVHSINIQDFCPPTIEQIQEFLKIQESAENVSVSAC